MKILYGVQGTGNGHITRARVMARALAARDDVQVDFLFSGREANKFFDMEIFGNYQLRTGMTFHHKEGAIDHLTTASQLKPLQFMRDVKQLDLSDYDLVLNDFEPVTAWAAKRQGVTCISISHQDAFRYEVPKRGFNRMNRLLLDYFAPADIHLGVHWYHFGQTIMPPFIEDEYVHGASGSHVLVYLPFEALDEITMMLEPISEVNFLCFHPDIDQPEQDGNISWHPTSKNAFHHALQQATGVIANGGFELSSECLKLGKKLLIKPLHGQFEQLSNVLTLESLDLCRSMHDLDVDALEAWLKLPPGEPIHYPDDPQLLIDWLLERNWQDTQSLCARLWQQVRFPEPVRRKLSRYQLAG
ncbi:MJ1255/VC2487 family glycosyltransferase [Saliniradius amylolyticus]|nr:MJ1255/VC2487 family glycosyltransferase [Saliniradius amylolyticus]